jgi:mono/diheme cytochrome c family protein
MTTMRRGAPAALLATTALIAVGAVSNAASRAPVVSSQAATRAPAAADPRAYIEAHCTTCHNDRGRTGGLSLASADIAKPAADAELWEKVLHKVVTGQMPPAGRPRPAPADTKALTSWLTTTLDRAAVAQPRPGRVGVHRMNRAEYANAIRDLLQLEIDAKALLLPDEADGGFDNIAASLAVSPSHLERYLAAARHISRLAVGDPTLGTTPGSTLYRIPKLLEQDVRVSEDLPFGSRGGLAVRHTFPLDGEYVFRVRLRRQVYDYIIGMGSRQTLDLRIDGRRVARFTVGGEAPGTPGPLTWNGEIVGDTPYELYMHAADAGLEFRGPVTAGPHTVGVSFVDSPWEPDLVTQPLPVDFTRGSDEHYDGYAAVDALAIQGPYNAGGAGDTPSRRVIFTCTPRDAAGERPCARTILTSLATRAYRRPATDEDVQTLLGFYDRGRGASTFDAGIQAALERILVSPQFLYRVEHDPPGAAAGTVYRLSDIDLASRLSFFLWSSIPDEELMREATRGTLSRPLVLDQQVRRMLRDPRARALVDNFSMQWLGVRKAEAVLPDPDRFPEFDENLRRAFVEETSRFVESQFRDDRSIVDLLTADYSFLNERLAEHYSVPGIYGERFRRVTFRDTTRGGLLGQGSVLLVTSYPDRTTPVLRGFWVLETLLGMPPPPPPPNVPDLDATGEDGRPRSMREQMEVHRRNPACAVCHVRMDPLGFALENFDAIGRWRTTSAGVPIDTSVTFADGSPIAGAQGLRRFVTSHQDRYVETFASKLLMYALGRHLDHHDQPAVRAITRDAAAGGYRWSAIVLAIVRSMPFQMRQTAS